MIFDIVLTSLLVQHVFVNFEMKYCVTRGTYMYIVLVVLFPDLVYIRWYIPFLELKAVCTRHDGNGTGECNYSDITSALWLLHHKVST